MTTPANELLNPIHDRMPVILNPETYDLWLDPIFVQSQRIRDLLCPYEQRDLVAYSGQQAGQQAPQRLAPVHLSVG